METILIGHITVGMLIAFVLGVLALLTYAWKTSVEHKKGYTAKRYMRLSLPNIAFHLVASLAVFFLLHEISEVIIKNWLPLLEQNGVYHYSLSALTGAFGSVFVAAIFEYARKKQNTIDPNVKDN